MKKAIIILIILLCVMRNAIIVLAGSLNDNESAVVSVAQGEFEYNGVKYKVAPGYVNDLINYLCQDSIDLTSGQKNTAIQKIYSNVEKGVSEGYLIPVDQVSNTEIDSENDTKADDSKSSTSENSRDQVKKTRETNAKDDNTKNSKSLNSDKKNNKSKDSNSTYVGSKNDKTSSSKANDRKSGIRYNENVDGKISENQEATPNDKDFVGDIVGDSNLSESCEVVNSSEESNVAQNISKEQSSKSKIVYRSNCSIHVVNEKDECLLKLNTTIKNTGFNIMQTIVVLAIVVTLFLITLAVAIKQIYFARKNE